MCHNHDSNEPIKNISLHMILEVDHQFSFGSPTTYLWIKKVCLLVLNFTSMLGNDPLHTSRRVTKDVANTLILIVDHQITRKEIFFMKRRWKMVNNYNGYLWLTSHINASTYPSLLKYVPSGWHFLHTSTRINIWRTNHLHTKPK